ncbi:hypothetical protein G6045_09755 [Streptomyces sp. YC504]|uniref:Uncharacterized protein n=1 Tax=Streptomyces mesophilus TaxID=1775132 RepID=A0A6G4XEJ2_9ACTN|nr:hypothetical protein [Streptomyces mesophilus]NGO75955.1 hypothetical protein [Streptomyces mesophilus]
MPLHIGSVTADVTVLDGELPLSERQLGQVAEAVLRLLAARERDRLRQRESTLISRSAQPSSPVKEG